MGVHAIIISVSKQLHRLQRQPPQVRLWLQLQQRLQPRQRIPTPLSWFWVHDIIIQNLFWQILPVKLTLIWGLLTTKMQLSTKAARSLSKTNTLSMGATTTTLIVKSAESMVVNSEELVICLLISTMQHVRLLAMIEFIFVSRNIKVRIVKSADTQLIQKAPSSISLKAIRSIVWRGSLLRLVRIQSLELVFKHVIYFSRNTGSCWLQSRIRKFGCQLISLEPDTRFSLRDGIITCLYWCNLYHIRYNNESKIISQDLKAFKVYLFEIWLEILYRLIPLQVLRITTITLLFTSTNHFTTLVALEPNLRFPNFHRLQDNGQT